MMVEFASGSSIKEFIPTTTSEYDVIKNIVEYRNERYGWKRK